MRLLRSVLVLVLLTACGSSERTAGSSAAIAGYTTGEDTQTRPASRTIDGEDAPPPAIPSRTLGESATPAVVRRGSVVDVSFAGADVRDAMRMLAEAGELDVVVEEGVSGTVDADLHDVRPIDAMVAIAEAHGAVVEVSGRTVIVRNAH